MALASGGACGGLKSFSHPRAAEKAVRISKIVDLSRFFLQNQGTRPRRLKSGPPYPRHVMLETLPSCGGPFEKMLKVLLPNDGDVCERTRELESGVSGVRRKMVKKR